jgi:hypothetical protein
MSTRTICSLALVGAAVLLIAFGMPDRFSTAPARAFHEGDGAGMIFLGMMICALVAGLVAIMIAASRPLVAVVAALLLFAPHADAKGQDNPRAEQTDMTVRKAMEVLAGLRALDGRQVIVKDAVILQPYDFKNGALRLVIASNLATLIQLEQTTDKARVQILMELRRDANQQRLEPGTPEFAEFSRQYEEMLNKPWQGKLEMIETKALNLDVNEIPASVLFALQPILK